MLIKYSVKYTNDSSSTEYDEGLVSGKDYNECIKRLEDLYGVNNLYWFSFCPLVDVLTKADLEENIWDKD